VDARSNVGKYAGIATRKLIRSVWQCSSCAALVACAAQQPVGPKPLLTKPDVGVAAPSASAAAPPAPSPRTDRAFRTGSTVYGYWGHRAIIGTLEADDERWVGSFHVVGSTEEIRIDGEAPAPEADPDAPAAEPSPGEKVHAYRDCDFRASNGGSLSDADCLSEESTLELAGMWLKNGVGEPFYLRTASPGAMVDDDYFAAGHSMKTPTHACAPFVEALSLNEHRERASVVYRLSWPCEAQGRESTFEPYLAELEQAPPHRLLWSSPWRGLADRDALNDVSLTFGVFPLSARLELYVGRAIDQFQSPTSSSHNSSDSLSVWAVDLAGRYGSKLDLPTADSGQGGWCIAQSASNDVWLLDLDGDKLPEIVVQSRVSTREDRVGPSGEVECVDGPSTESISAYRLDTTKLEWSALPKPRGLGRARLERGTHIDL